MSEGPVALRSCVVDTFDGTGDPVRCGQPGQPWTSPNGAHAIVCPEHQAQFERDAQEPVALRRCRLAIVQTSLRARHLYRHFRKVGFDRDTANVMVAGFCLAEPGNGRVATGLLERTVGELLTELGDHV